MTAPDFQRDLVRGKLGEQFLKANHAGLGLTWPAEGERRWDLECALNGKHVEVKCDSYDPLLTQNFFMEQRTRVAGKPGALLGGPWRALAEGVDTFVYLFHSPKRAPSFGYWFYDLPLLVEHLDAHLEEYEVRRVRGGRLQAVGRLVPRDSLKDLYTRVVY